MSRLRKSARGQPCLVRLPGVCNGNKETTVLAHVNGGGMGMKNHDYNGAFCCSSCHDVLDGRVKSEFSDNLLRLWHWEGVSRTWDHWVETGLIEIKE